VTQVFGPPLLFFDGNTFAIEIIRNKMNKNQQFVMVQTEDLEAMSKMIKEMHQHLLEKQSSPKLLNEYISEGDAKKEFGRKTTWFWTQRRSGRLSPKRLGNRIYYLKADLLKLFDEE